MYGITREIDFCYGHRLLNYDGKCRHLHGHNGRAIITIAADSLDDRGMVFDFSDVKKAVATWIDENLDHRMLLCKDDPVVPILEGLGEPLRVVLLRVGRVAQVQVQHFNRLALERAQVQGVRVVAALAVDQNQVEDPL